MAAYAHVHERGAPTKNHWEDIQEENCARMYSGNHGWSVHMWEQGTCPGASYRDLRWMFYPVKFELACFEIHYFKENMK